MARAQLCCTNLESKRILESQLDSLAGSPCCAFSWSLIAHSTGWLAGNNRTDTCHPSGGLSQAPAHTQCALHTHELGRIANLASAPPSTRFRCTGRGGTPRSTPATRQVVEHDVRSAVALWARIACAHNGVLLWAAHAKHSTLPPPPLQGTSCLTPATRQIRPTLCSTRPPTGGPSSRWCRLRATKASTEAWLHPTGGLGRR